MAKHTSVSSIQSRIGGNEKEISQMFNQIVGVGDDIDLKVCWPKYKQLHDVAQKLLTVTRLFSGSEDIMKCFIGDEANLAEMKKMAEWCVESTTALKAAFSVDLASYEWNFDNTPPELRKKFAREWREIKKSTILARFMLLCDKLAPYKTQLAASVPDYRFILDIPSSFTPFTFCGVDIKRLIVILVSETANMANGKSSIDAANKVITFVMTVLNKYFTLGHMAYKIISSPDIDLDNFSSMFIGQISDIKKHLPRCDEAFKRIEASIGMLKTNFTTYYRSFLSSGSGSMMIESFILDVAKDSDKMSPVVSLQYRQIIGFLQKNAKGRVNDPSMKMLFDSVENNFKSLDAYENIGNIDKPDESATKDPKVVPPAPDTPQMQERRANSKKSVNQLMREMNFK